MDKILSTKDIGLKIKERRRELKLTQEQLAKNIGLCYQQIQRYEKGLNQINVEKLQVIARALRTPLTFFFTEGFQTRTNDSTSSESRTIHFLSQEEVILLKKYNNAKSELRKIINEALKVNSK